MAAKESKSSSAVIIKKLVKTTIEGKEVYSTQRFSKIKVTALAQDIYDVASAMTVVLTYPVSKILRQDNNVIINE